MVLTKGSGSNCECLFGAVVNAGIRLNECGRIIAGCWQDTPYHFADVRLDVFLTMPNHLHGIIEVGDGDVGTQVQSRGAMRMTQSSKQPWALSAWAVRCGRDDAAAQHGGQDKED